MDRGARLPLPRVPAPAGLARPWSPPFSGRGGAAVGWSLGRKGPGREHVRGKAARTRACVCVRAGR